MTNDLIEAHLRHCAAAGYAETTIRDRGEVLRRLDRELPYGLDQAATEELAGWLSRDGWSVETKRTYYKHLAGFFRWASRGRDAHLDWDPSLDLTPPRARRGLPRPVSETDLALLYERVGSIWRLPVQLGANAGLRACEIAGVDRGAITEAEMIVTGKGGETRCIPTHPEIWALVAGLPSGPVVRLTRGKPVGANALSRYAALEFDRVGLPTVTLHRLRHRFATRLLLPRELGGAGADIRTVQELMGHKSLASTQIYTLVTDGQRRLAIGGLPVLNAATS